MIYKSSHLEELTWPSPGHSGLLWLYQARAGGQLWWFPLQIQNLFKKWVWIQVEPSWSEQVTLPSPQYPSPIQPYWELQCKFQISLFRFRFSSKNGSGYKLNHSNRWMWPEPLLVSQSLFWVLQMLQARSEISIFRFRISLKNGSRYKLNHPNRRRSNFPPLAFCGCFVFFHLIRKGTNMGPLDLESPQTGAPENIWIVHFGQDLKCTKNTPPLPRREPNMITPYCL